MKKLVIMAYALFMAIPCYAATTSGTATPSHTALHTHEVNTENRDEFGYGVGADIVLYEPHKYGVDEIVAEGRYDVENRETRVYVVARINPWQFAGN